MKTLSLALPLVLASAVVAQEPTRMPEEYQKELSRYVGEWETESTIAGETQSGTFTATWAPGEPCLIYHYEVSDGSADTTVHGTGIIGWDYGAEQVKEVSFNSMGETQTTMWELQDGVLRGIRDGIVSGQPLKATVANIWHDDGTWTHRVTDRMISGEKQEDVKIRFSRKSAAGPMPDSIKEQILNNLIGNWDVTITMGGETLTGTASAKWSAGEHAVIIEEQGSAPFEVRIIGVLGWEANNKELVHHAFMSSGDYFTIRYTDIGKDKWTGRVSGTFRGSPRNSPASVEWEGDSFTYRDSPGGEDFVYRATRQ